MQKYRIMARTRILGYVEALNGKEAAEKYDKGEYRSADNIIESPVIAVPDSNVALILKAYRKENELTWQEAADKIGMTRMTLYRLERRKHKPSRTTLQRMREVGIL